MTVTAPELNVVGTSPIRHDGVDKVTGHAVFGVDVRIPGMLHAQVLRSPHAHARITRIDTSRAEALSGVLATMTSADIPLAPAEGRQAFGNAIRLKAMNVVARDTALYHGHAVAAVAATSAHIAAEALRLIDVDYEVLDAVLDAKSAIAPDAPILHPDLRMETAGEFADSPGNVAKHIVLEEGDIEAGFAAADVVLEREFSTSTIHQGYIEPHNATAFWRADGTLEIHCSTQGHFGVRNEISQMLGIPVSNIRVVPAEIGGGFGGKLTNYVAPIAVVLARKTGRPVKLTMDRTETLLGTGPAPAAYIRAKIGATSAGDLTAAQLEMHFEAGAFPGSSVGGGANCGFAPYRLENFRVDGYDVVVNKPKSQAFRAPGAPQAAFAVERHDRRAVRDPWNGSAGVSPAQCVGRGRPATQRHALQRDWQQPAASGRPGLQPLAGAGLATGRPAVRSRRGLRLLG